MQADVFVPSPLTPILTPRTPAFRLRRASVNVEELIATVARYLGAERSRADRLRASPRLAGSSLAPQSEADFQLLQYGEYLLASAIGAASSRLVLSLLLRKRSVSTRDAFKLLDDAHAAIHYNREILQNALDHVRQGIAVFDKDVTLVCWNRQFGELLDLPHGLTRVGITLDDILRYVAEHGARDAAAGSRPSSASGSPAIRPRMRPSLSALPNAGWWSRCAPTACPMADWSRPSPTSRQA